MKKLLTLFVILLFSQIVTAGNVICQDDHVEWNVRIGQSQSKLSPGYDPHGRIDPFMPIISDDHPKSVLRVHQIHCVSNPTLEKLHLSQLELSGIIITERRPLAIVQEANGKGHIILEEMCIDKGKVAEILKDRVIVHTEMLDLHGAVSIKKVQMKLKKKIN